MEINLYCLLGGIFVLSWYWCRIRWKASDNAIIEFQGIFHHYRVYAQKNLISRELLKNRIFMEEYPLKKLLNNFVIATQATESIKLIWNSHHVAKAK